jgi:hypothetical protein
VNCKLDFSECEVSRAKIKYNYIVGMSQVMNLALEKGKRFRVY